MEPYAVAGGWHLPKPRDVGHPGPSERKYSRPAHPSNWRRGSGSGEDKEGTSPSVHQDLPAWPAHTFTCRLFVGHCSEPTVTTKTRGGTTIYQRKPDTRSRHADIGSHSGLSDSERDRLICAALLVGFSLSRVGIRIPRFLGGR